MDSAPRSDADVIVVGGGPAGLSGALMLARCRLRVLVFDTGHQRNLASQGIHGYMTREGMPPKVWLDLARKEAEQFGARFRKDHVQQVLPVANGFEVRAGDRSYRARKVLMATGVCDRIPDLPGLEPLYGTSVFHCPYCDGWEVRDRDLGAYGKRNKAVRLANLLRTWSDRVTLFTDGPAKLNTMEREQLQRAGIALREEKVRALQARSDQLTAVALATGEQVPCGALFFANGHAAACSIMTDLGCAHLRTGAVITDRKQRTRIPGLFVAGDACMDTHMVSVACADGAKAAITIHQELVAEGHFTARRTA